MDGFEAKRERIQDKLQTLLHQADSECTVSGIHDYCTFLIMTGINLQDLHQALTEHVDQLIGMII